VNARGGALFLLAVTAAAQPAYEFKTPAFHLSIAREGGAIRVERQGEVILESDDVRFDTSGRATKLLWEQPEGLSITLLYESTHKDGSVMMRIEPSVERIRVRTWILHSSGTLTPVIRYKLAASGYWYGGGFQGWRAPQTFPLNQASIPRKWFLAEGNTQGTPAWCATKGVGLWVRTDHDLRYEIAGGMLAFEVPAESAVTYDILIARNIRQVVDSITSEIGWAKTVPPADYFGLPVYTTWVEHKTETSQQRVLEFARNIRNQQLPAGVLEIDDNWESRYGDLTFDTTKFPEPKAMTAELHRLGFRVTLWVHPFVNTDSRTYRSTQMQSLLLRDSSGHAGLIKWWNGVAAVWDFTEPRAADEFRTRLRKLEALGIDGFKFDGGDVNLVPRDMRAHQPITPAQYADVYNRETAAKWEWEETRVGVYSQPLGVVQRLIDKHSVWGLENGLAATVPEAITVSLRGFPYVMPDMVGGNQYDNDKIDKELLIRWAQASALMPLVQFSWGPWHFDDETVRLCREASNLHITFAPYIIRLAQAVPNTGEPILRPLWYNTPDDVETHTIADQFMLGTDVVIAPVLQRSAIARRLYLPKGVWIDWKTKKKVAGGRWIDGYPAPLDTLPVFVRAGFRINAGRG
jgi:myogenesis-regulating glycosidase